MHMFEEDFKKRRAIKLCPFLLASIDIHNSFEKTGSNSISLQAVDIMQYDITF